MLGPWLWWGTRGINNLTWKQCIYITIHPQISTSQALRLISSVFSYFTNLYCHHLTNFIQCWWRLFSYLTMCMYFHPRQLTIQHLAQGITLHNTHGWFSRAAFNMSTSKGNTKIREVNNKMYSYLVTFSHVYHLTNEVRWLVHLVKEARRESTAKKIYTLFSCQRRYAREE